MRNRGLSPPALTAADAKSTVKDKKGVGRMWRSISLRNRLNLIFASLFALWLVADAIHDVWQASGRSRVETQSAMRLTKDFVATTLALAPEAPEPEVVKNLVASLSICATCARGSAIRRLLPQFSARRTRSPKRRVGFAPLLPRRPKQPSFLLR